MTTTASTTANPATYPPHYTAQDRAAVQSVLDWMAKHNYSQAALGRLARVNAGTLNQIIKGTYATSPSKQILALQNAIKSLDERRTSVIAPVETSVWRMARVCCKMAREGRNFSVLSGYVGVGKTFALRQYASTTPNTHFFEATPTMTVTAMVRLMAREVAGFSGSGSVEDRLRAVVNELRGTDSLLIMDEAETLTPKTLQVLRRIRDLAGVGVVLAGTEHLAGIIRPLHGQFDQIRSRTGFWPETLKQISREDAEALLQAGFGQEDLAEDFIEAMWTASQGSARMLVEGLIAAVQRMRGDHPLRAKLVKEIARKALSLHIA